MLRRNQRFGGELSFHPLPPTRWQAESPPTPPTLSLFLRRVAAGKSSGGFVVAGVWQEAAAVSEWEVMRVQGMLKW